MLELCEEELEALELDWLEELLEEELLAALLEAVLLDDELDELLL